MSDEDTNPVVEETQEQPAEQAEAPQEQDTQAEETQNTESAPAETVETSQVTEEEPAEAIDWSQYVPNVQTQVPVDENGQIDPVQWEQQMMQKIQFQQSEVASWKNLENKHPEIRSDAELREMILAKRVFDVQQGRKGSLEAAADSVFKRLSGAKNEGRESQKTSITVQKSGALQKPSGKPSTTTPDARDRIRMGDQSAIQSQLTAWLDEGKI